MINLKEVITKYPECLESASKLRSYLVDLYPNEKRDVFILCTILDCGIADEIKGLCGEVDDIALNRFCNMLENNYGITPQIAKACILMWCKVYSYSKGLDIVDGVLKGIGTCTDKNIVIPYGVTEIAECAFGRLVDNGPFDSPEYYGANIESVFIPDSVKKIGSYAFSGCYPLEKLEIPDSVTELGVLEKEDNFKESTIKEIKLGRGLDEIQEETFRRCVSLKKITIYENTTIEPYGNFYGEWDEYDDYPEIEEVNFIGSIEGWLLNPLFIPNAISLFINGKDCKSITELVIPDTVYGLCRGTLNDFRNLHKVIIGKNVVNIERSAFNDNIEEIVFNNIDCLWEQTDYHPHPDSEPDHDRGWYTTKTISFKGLSPKEIANYIKEQHSRCSWRKVENQEKNEKPEAKEQLKKDDSSLSKQKENSDIQEKKNVKYELCPKCETNYIKEDESCCDVCKGKYKTIEPKYYYVPDDVMRELEWEEQEGRKMDLGYLEDIDDYE